MADYARNHVAVAASPRSLAASYATNNAVAVAGFAPAGTFHLNSG